MYDAAPREFASASPSLEIFHAREKYKMALKQQPIFFPGGPVWPSITGIAVNNVNTIGYKTEEMVVDCELGIYNPGVYPRWRETIFFPFLWRHRATFGATLRQNHSTHVSKSQFGMVEPQNRGDLFPRRGG
jgi:hypothetical protein